MKELLPGIHGHQKKTLALFVLGMVLSGCAGLQRLAETLHERGLSEAKMSSIERRLARFIANERIVVPVIWKLFLAQVLPYFRGQPLHFVLDNTPFQDELTIVYIGLLVHSRVLPIAWAVMPGQTKWEECIASPKSSPVGSFSSFSPRLLLALPPGQKRADHLWPNHSSTAILTTKGRES